MNFKIIIITTQRFSCLFQILINQSKSFSFNYLKILFFWISFKFFLFRITFRRIDETMISFNSANSFFLRLAFLKLPFIKWIILLPTPPNLKFFICKVSIFIEALRFLRRKFLLSFQILISILKLFRIINESVKNYLPIFIDDWDLGWKLFFSSVMVLDWFEMKVDWQIICHSIYFIIWNIWNIYLLSIVLQIFFTRKILNFI